MASPDLALQASEQQSEQQTPQQMFGENLEYLPDELQRELWDIICKQELEDSLPRLREIRAITQRRLFFKGRQYDCWSERGQIWMSPETMTAWVGADQSSFQQPTFQHVTNIYQSNGLSVMSVISQNAVPAQFAPQSARDPKDVSTAKQATKISELIHRNNDMQNKADDATYFMWNDGFLGGYVRYVSDGERFGWDEQEEIESVEQEIAPSGIQCESCGYTESGLTTEEMPLCPECGNPMMDVPPQMAEVPMPTGQTVRTPKGQEVIEVLGAFNIKRTMYAQDQSQFMYLTWITDLHKAQAKSLFPHLRERIDSGGSNFGGNPSEGYEKMARCLLFMGAGTITGDSLADLGTLRRVWLRPTSFERVKDDTRREQLQSLYSEGCFVTFYNDIYCESRSECMDEKWETMQTMPGEGQFRECLGSSLLPIQEQLNDASNMIFEQGMYGTPEAFAAKGLMDPEARAATGAMPGNMSFVELSANQDIRTKILYTDAVEPSQAMQALKAELLGPISQMITGNSPALSGGDTGTNDTARGIAIQRNQALGRIGRSWRRLQVFWANLDAKAVRCFAQNRSEDVEVPRLNEGGEYESDFINLEDVQGKITAFPEVDQQYPVLQAEIRTLLMAIFEGNNEVLKAVLMGPDNMEYSLNRMGLTEVELPGEQQKKKTYMVIDLLVQQQPKVLPPDPKAMLMPGQVPQDIILPSIPPDPDVDNLPIAKATANKWLLSDEGLKAMVENEPGYANVRAYMKACQQLGDAKMLNQAVAAAGLEGGGPGADLGGATDMQPEGEEGPAGAGEGESATTE